MKDKLSDQQEEHYDPDLKALGERSFVRCRNAHAATERMLKHNGELMRRSERSAKREPRIRHR